MGQNRGEKAEMMLPSLRQAESRLRDDRQGRLRWVEPDLGYPGRIVNLRLGRQGYHFIVTPETARLEGGEYPAPDATLLLPGPRVLEKLVGGSLTLGDALRTGQARVWGNLNDIQAFLKIAAER